MRGIFGDDFAAPCPYCHKDKPVSRRSCPHCHVAMPMLDLNEKSLWPDKMAGRYGEVFRRKKKAKAGSAISLTTSRPDP